MGQQTRVDNSYVFFLRKFMEGAVSDKLTAPPRKITSKFYVILVLFIQNIHNQIKYFLSVFRFILTLVETMPKTNLQYILRYRISD